MSPAEELADNARRTRELVTSAVDCVGCGLDVTASWILLFTFVATASGLKVGAGSRGLFVVR